MAKTEPALSREDELNRMRKRVRRIEDVWFLCCGFSLIGTFMYLFLVYKKGIFPGNPVRYILIGVCLLVVFFCIYMLPIVLKKNRRYAEYSEKYKKTYVKPFLDEAFGVGSYQEKDSISLKEIASFSLLKKIRSARANDGIRGVYEGVPFIRYYLALGFEKGQGTTDCLMIALEMNTGLKTEVQVVHDDLRLGGKEYEMPDGYAQILTGNKEFDRTFALYAEDKEEGERFLSEMSVKRIKRRGKSFPAAIYLDRNKIYILIRREKDTMEAPVYRPIREEKCIREAGQEVEMIRTWINALKECFAYVEKNT